MPKPILIRSAAELLESILAGNMPADRKMDSYFRMHRNMGVRDRGFVAETVYGCLRELRLLEYVAASSFTQDVVACYLLANGYSARALEESGFHGKTRAMTERLRTLDKNNLPIVIKANMPDWLAERFLERFDVSDFLSMASALNQPAPIDIRVNTLKAEREKVREYLARDGFIFEPTPYSPVGLRRQDRTPLFHTKSFKDGLFEVQDEGSQLVSMLLEPMRQDMVVDFCAGSGGKTLHLGALMANRGSVYAFEISPKRLEKLKPRLKRSGLNNVRTVAISHERDARVQRLKSKIDRVLVDVPCSGTGTLRRNPDIKWREINLPELTEKQKRILAAAAELVKPGGRLVYATCSLLHEENDEIVDAFLTTHPEFRILPVGEILSRRHIPLAADGPALRLYPHQHQTDGFYAMALERNPE